jgi:hypothetical protein
MRADYIHDLQSSTTKETSQDRFQNARKINFCDLDDQEPMLDLECLFLS